MQGPQAHSSILAPAATISESAPHSESIVRTSFEPGETESSTSGCTVLPLSIAATVSISSMEEFVQEPIHTWSIFMPSISLTGRTLSGLCGHAASGTREERSTVSVSSYFASGSGASGTKSFSLSCDFKNPSVISSEGNTDVVAPSSAPIFVIVALSGTESVFMPSP